jgi:hypothetical protein
MLVSRFRLPRDHGVCFPYGAAFIAGPFQGFVGDLRPKLFQGARRCLARVSFGVIWSPHGIDAPGNGTEF